LRLGGTSGSFLVQPCVQTGPPTNSCPGLCPEKTKGTIIHKTSQDRLPSFSMQKDYFFSYLIKHRVLNLSVQDKVFMKLEVRVLLCISDKEER